MSVESEILRIQHNIANTYAAVSEKGGEVPLQPTSANLAAAVASIKTVSDIIPGDGLSKNGNTLSVDIPVRDLTQEEFDALPEEEKSKGLIFLPGDEEGGGGFHNVYSTEEVRIGTWVDGRPLYRRVYQFSVLNISNLNTVTSSTSDMFELPFPNISRIIKLYGRYYRGENSYSFLSPHGASTNYFVRSITYDEEKVTLFISGIGTSSISNDSAFFVLEYTKTTDKPDT